MSRVSDTRLRTREAAAKLVAAGRRPHELTVDLIYAEIRQGSRTTINDELKLWKDEQAKIDALSAALPPAVADAMLAAWAVAVEQGERVFDRRREDVEGELAAAQEHARSLETAQAALQAEIQGLRERLDKRDSDVERLREDWAAERAAKEAAIARSGDLTRQLETLRAEADRAQEAAKAEHQARVAELEAAMTDQEVRFREEIDKATARLEGVQKHVMLQVGEARESAKRADAQLGRVNRKVEQQAEEIQRLKTELSLAGQAKARNATDLEQMVSERQALREQRESLTAQLANAAGKLDAQAERIRALERLEQVFVATKEPRKP